MPKSHRDLLKRQLAHAYYDLDLAGEHITNVVEEFAPVHPELIEPLTAILAGILIQQDVLKTFVRDVWGIDNPDWHSWQNTP